MVRRKPATSAVVYCASEGCPMSNDESPAHGTGSLGESTAVPAYCLHKPSGQAVVYLHRRAVYLGAFGSPKSKEAYPRPIPKHIPPPHGLKAPPIDKGAPVSVP